MDEATDPAIIPDMKMSEFMELSLLSMFTGDQMHREVDVLHKGAFYRLHMCVQFVSPGENVYHLKEGNQ